MRLAVIMPAHNEEGSISDVIRSVPRLLSPEIDVSVFVVDDGSTDATAKKAAEAGATVLPHSDRCGLAAAFRTGLAAALASGAGLIATLDADGQYAGGELHLLLEKLRSAKADLVIGDRRVWSRRHMRFGNRIGNIVGSFMLRLLAGIRVTDASSGFRLFTAKLGRKLRITSEHTYTHEMLIQARACGCTTAEVPVSFLPRRFGRSKLVRTLRHHVLRSCGTILRALFLFHPLRKFLFLSLGFGLLACMIVVWSAFQGSSPVLAGILAGFLLIAAVQFLALGIIADSFASQRRLSAEESSARS